MSDRDTARTFEEAVSRRKLLTVAGASGAAALAGCADNEGETGGEQGAANTPDSEGGSEVYDATFTGSLINVNPENAHFNSAANQNYSEPAGRTVFAPLLKYSFTSGEFILAALEDLTFGDQEFTMTFREDLTWENGDAWTTADFDVQLQLGQKTESSLFGYVDDWEIVDDYTVTLQLSGPTNPKIIRFELSNFFVTAKQETHEEFLDKDVTEYLQWAYDDPVASGPFALENKDRQAFEFTRNEEFYDADNINFENYVLESYGGNTAAQQALISGSETDSAWSLFTPPEIAEQYPDHVVEVNVPAKWGYGIVFNHDDDHFGKRAVRQAVAHVINREQIVENAGPRSKFATGVPCGIAPRDQEYWLGDRMSDFETYGAGETQAEAAAGLLEAEGYTKVDGTWQAEDGTTLGGDYYSPAGWTDWTTATQTVVDQLNSFGFDFSISTIPVGDFFGRYAESDFGMGAFYWLPGGSRSAFPYFPQYYQLLGTDIGGGHNYEQFAKQEQTIPGMDGGEMTLTPLDTVEKIAEQPSDDDARQYVQEAAWHNHIELPFLGLVSKFEQSWVTNDEWTEAPMDSPNRRVKWAPFWWPQSGELQYDGE